MAFKFVISQGGKSYQTEKDAPLAGKKIGDTFEGSLIGLPGYKLAITGGSDKSGFPMRKDIEGQARKKLLIAAGAGFKGTKREKKKKFRPEGMRKRRSLRGNTVSAEVAQINCKVVEAGDKTLDEYFKKEGEEAPKKQG
ncbi:MAG: 30S ribosomal protein S6e [Candidatus Aenigmarchaeota archaeon]|nr:30S ribosomal protein S6e [Candidatus Aenigmarchaeota archaeon]